MCLCLQFARLSELNLRSLKTPLGMDVLRGQSVDVVGKEIVMHPVACHLNPSPVRRL